MPGNNNGLTERCLATEQAKAQFVTKTWSPAPGAQDILDDAREALREKKSSVSRMALVKSSAVRVDYEDYLAANINLDDSDGDTEAEQRPEEPKSPVPPPDSPSVRRKPRRTRSMDLPTAPQRSLGPSMEPSGAEAMQMQKSGKKFNFLSGLTIARGACDDPDDEDATEMEAQRSKSTYTFVADRDDSRAGKAMDMLRSIDPTRKNKAVVPLMGTAVDWLGQPGGPPAVPAHGRRSSMIVMPTSRQYSDGMLSLVDSNTAELTALSAGSALYASSSSLPPSPQFQGFLNRDICSEAGAAPAKSSSRSRLVPSIMSSSGAASPVPSINTARSMMGRNKSGLPTTSMIAASPGSLRSGSMDLSRAGVDLKRSVTGGGLDLRANLGGLSAVNLSSSGPLSASQLALTQPSSSTSGTLPPLISNASGTLKSSKSSKTATRLSAQASTEDHVDTPASLFGRLKDILHM